VCRRRRSLKPAGARSSGEITPEAPVQTKPASPPVQLSQIEDPAHTDLVTDPLSCSTTHPPAQSPESSSGKEDGAYWQDHGDWQPAAVQETTLELVTEQLESITTCGQARSRRSSKTSKPRRSTKQSWSRQGFLVLGEPIAQD
jgi:hypothetical protein